MIQALRLTYADLNAMTFPQVWNLMTAGKMPKPGVRKFKSSAESRAWRESQKHG